MTLRAPFQTREAFLPAKPYRLMPFRFIRLDASRYVVANDVGEHVVLERPDLVRFVRRQLPPSSEIYRALKARHFIFDDISGHTIDLAALKYRTRAERLANFTGLHIFVVTLRCDHSCHYCQVSRQTEERTAFDMTTDHADAALAFAFRSPSRSLKIELQGGEPFLNFDLVRYIVERALVLNESAKRNLQFVVATNLAKLTDDILSFCRERGVFLSTSLDGPRALHDANRPLRGGSGYDATVDGIRRARAALGPDAVSALMTTTPASLDRVEAIIDEYVVQGFSSIFLRNLSPFGFAVRTSLVRKYDVADWLQFYRRGLRHVLALNAKGTAFREEYTAIVLRKMFAPSGASYVDLQSPAGIGIGAIVYNYDGDIYASDEGRMLAEMGDKSYRLGRLGLDAYEEVMTSDALLAPLEDSLLESAPSCTDCGFLPWCGADPVFHSATQGDPVGHKAFSAFCGKQMGVFRHIVTLLEDDPAARRTLMSWI